MTRAPIYVPFDKLQQYITMSARDFGRPVTFPEAVQALYQQGCYATEMPTIKVDFTKWDVQDIDQLAALYQHVWVDVTVLVYNPTQYFSFVDEDYFIFHSRDILPLLVEHDGKYVPHTHNYFELNYVMKGQLEMLIQGEQRVLETGSLCIVAPGASHRAAPSGNAIVVDFAIKRSTFRTSFNDVLNSQGILADFFKTCLYNSHKNYLLFQIQPTTAICSVIQQIFAEYYNKQKLANEICCQYMTVFLFQVMRNYSETYRSNLSNYHTVADQMPAILTYLEDNYQTISLSHLASFFGYDPAYLGKQIKRSVGMTFREIVSKLKVDHAQQLLQYTDWKISRIAKEVGYNSPNHFSRDFHLRTGISPAEFRAQCRENHASD